MKINVKSRVESNNVSRFRLGSKLHVIACIGLLTWTVFLCVFIFTPKSVYADKRARITEVAITLKRMALKIPGFGSETSIHIAYFAVLMLFVGCCLLTSGQISFLILLRAIGMVLVFALFTELLQKYLVPGRSAQMKDVVANTFGIGVGGLMLSVGFMIRRVFVIRKAD